MMDGHLEEVVRIRSEVERLRLIGWELITVIPIATLAKAYNGTGPECAPARFRQFLDRITAPFQPAVMGHDVEFEHSDGTVGSFNRANRHLFWNCITCANDVHPWYCRTRYALYCEAWLMYRACCKFGWIAWIQAYHKNQNKEIK